MKLKQKLNDWLLHFAETPYGPSALFILSFTEASFFPLPPDILLIALALGLRSKAYYFALICTLGSVLGGINGYLIGHYLWWNGGLFTPLAAFFFDNVPGFSEQLFFKIQHQYH